MEPEQRTDVAGENHWLKYMHSISKVWTGAACARPQCNQRNPHFAHSYGFHGSRPQTAAVLTCHFKYKKNRSPDSQGPLLLTSTVDSLLSEFSHLLKLSKDRNVRERKMALLFSVFLHRIFLPHVFLERGF